MASIVFIIKSPIPEGQKGRNAVQSECMYACVHKLYITKGRQNRVT